MSTAPVLLSIVIPFWNRREGVVAALRSIGLRPDPRHEVVLVDDGSTDGGAAAVEAVIAEDGLQGMARLLRTANGGPGAARNAGAAAATGEWLVFLDSDDLWFPWTLPRLTEALEDMPPPALGFMRTLDGDGPAETTPSPLRVVKYEGFLEAVSAFRGTPASVRVAGCNTVITRRLFMESGGFDPQLRCAEDVDLFLRVSHRGRCFVIEAPEMVRYAVAGDDRLSSDIPKVAAGLAFLQTSTANGRYPAAALSPHIFSDFMAGTVVYCALTAFASGWLGTAYRVVLANIWLLLRHGQARWAWRLLLLPILAWVRPNNFKCRMRPHPSLQTG